MAAFLFDVWRASLNMLRYLLLLSTDGMYGGETNGIQARFAVVAYFEELCQRAERTLIISGRQRMTA